MRATMHLDTAATTSVTSGQMVKRLGLAAIPSRHRKAQVADGKYIAILGTCCLTMELQGVKAGGAGHCDRQCQHDL